MLEGRTLLGGAELQMQAITITHSGLMHCTAFCFLLNNTTHETNTEQALSQSMPQPDPKQPLHSSNQVPAPEFEGQTKTRLGNPEVRRIVDTLVTRVRGWLCLIIRVLVGRWGLLTVSLVGWLAGWLAGLPDQTHCSQPLLTTSTHPPAHPQPHSQTPNPNRRCQTG